MMTRTFHPIGQGAFYTERFEKINIVYDCGCGVKKDSCKILDKVVEQSFKPTDKIDILFISHFDLDHINGIKKLKNWCDSIEYVVLPILNDIEKILLISIYNALDFKEEASLIENTSEYFDEGTKIIFVKRNRDKQEKNNTSDELIIPNDKPKDIVSIKNEEKIKSGTVIKLSSIKFLNWCFVPYNYKYIEREGKLEEKLENNDLDVKKIVNRDSDYITNNIEKIKEVYDEVFNKKLNESSMLLYSGPLEQKKDEALIVSFHVSLRYICHKRRVSNRIGCIYTGDANFDKVNIHDLFNKYWKNVGTIQIPHHGSRTTFKEDFFDDEFYFCPISAGRINSYKHPHHKVISSIFSNNSLPIIVNELPNFKFKQFIKRC